MPLLTDHKPIPSPRYKRAPITECIIELRVVEALSQSEIDGIASRLQATHPTSADVMAAEVTIDTVTGALTGPAASVPRGKRMVSEDGANVVLLTPNFLTTARLPPYARWEELFNRARDNWSHWLEVVGPRQLARVGVRYINRIDIPLPESGTVDLGEYLTFQPNTNELDLPVAHFFTQATLGSWKEHWLVNIASATSPVSVPNAVSILLDIDVHRFNELPAPSDDPWSMIGEAREIKNDIFQRVLTDKAKGLFDQ
jgi:uncharacterized protein (TIGR04255 family)